MVHVIYRWKDNFMLIQNQIKDISEKGVAFDL